MTTGNTAEQTKAGELGRVAFLDGQGELAMLEVSTPWSTAEIYLHGAHVIRFRKHNDAPLLFLSQCSRFNEDQPIRGGIPVILPWFGAREGLPQHGFARIKNWDLKEVNSGRDGSVSLLFRLPDCPEAASFPPFSAEYLVTVAESLTLQLRVRNESAEDVFTFENCLHTYFEISDVTAISIQGLKGVNYLDKVADFARKTEGEESIRISSEVDRVYLNTEGPVEIVDPRLSRKIIVEKEGSKSTVVWNPWIAKAQQMPDYGDDEYTRMVCVESGNVGPDTLRLPPQETSVLTVKLSTATLKP